MRCSIVLSFVGVCIAALWYQSTPVSGGGLEPTPEVVEVMRSHDAFRYAAAPVAQAFPRHGHQPAQ